MDQKASKRAFIKKSLVLGAGIPLAGNGLVSCMASGKETANTLPEKLNILILGGTSYLGPHQIAYAISRGHSITTFTRGQTKPTVHTELFDQVEMLIGDRQDNLTALENRKWDVVIDNSGRNAAWTRDSANLLKENVGHYIYVSSTGVYYPHEQADVDEDTPVLLEDPLNDDGKAPERDSFGVMKAKSELEAINIFGKDRVTVVRPTYMLGPADKTDRFMHWPLRLAQGGEVMVPGKKDDPVQYVDVRDIAEWMIRLAESKQIGTFNAVGPQDNQGVLEFVQGATEAFDAKSELILIDDYDFLKENRMMFIIPWIMPLDDYYASARVQNGRAISAGLTFRKVSETVKDTFDWWNSDAVTDERRQKYNNNPRSSMNREAEILEAWKAVEPK